ncbi:hypothetical protein CTEN210_16315 [Chaetoceros tenuissimus]|uniref:Peptidase M11 gametolysin domain-containing protein n=1 Tax=Chaetoceros tenuissimus TaxID=426638 RepID=A0AAD3HE61_9STRA|nr:hypothetical protein CTEN210_16315 [Chaetoceros tenuissimus]
MRFSSLGINVLITFCYTRVHLAQAEPIVIDASKPFTKTINDEIVCEKVVKLHGIIQKTSDIKDGVYGVESFACIVDPKYTPSGDTPGITLSMPDVGETFEEAFASAQATGHTELVVKNPLVNRSTLRLPSSSQEEEESANSFSGSMFYSQVVEPEESDEVVSKLGGTVRGRRASALTRQAHMCFGPHVQWRRPSNVDGSVQRGRKLAVNQFGTRSVVVFRAIVDGTAPSSTSATISENVFSTASDMITLSSQYSACSNNQLNFEAGVFTDFTYAASGVVEVVLYNVLNSFDDQAMDISNAIYTEFGNNMNQIDHKMFVVPPGTSYYGDSSWVAFAFKPGDNGWYNDDWILDVSTLMHETGHNLDLAHSGQPNDPDEPDLVEYGDTTCTMGYTTGVDRAICFNGAKSVELGWYDDRVATISPHFGDEFSGRLIGVNDYAISTSSDTLVIEIKNPDSSVNSLFVMYNKAEGINADTSEGADKVLITQGATGEQSWKLAEITPGQTLTIPNYFLGNSLSISTSVEASAGNVQYIATTIKFADTVCVNDSQCTTDLQNSCLSEQCVSSVCKIIAQGDCCGNGVCDAAEYCDTCDDCLNSSDHCNSIVASWSNARTNSGIFGISFDVTVTKDVYFHEISDVFVWESGTYTVNAYTREGTNTGENDLSNWVQVYSGSIVSSSVSGRSYITSIPFTSRIDTASGVTRAFYVDVTGSTPQFKIPYETNNNPVSNFDMSMSSATTRGASSGTAIGAARTDVGTFIGTLKYGYDIEVSPKPSQVPSISLQPSISPFPTTTGPQCGNNICELECGSCSSDCSATTDCGSLGTSPANYYNAQALHSIAFDVDVTSDIYIYGFDSVAIYSQSPLNVNAKIYSRVGSYMDTSNLDDWTLVYDKTFLTFASEFVQFVDLPFDEVQQSLQDTVRSFYIAFDVDFFVLVEDDPIGQASNDDMTLSYLSLRNQASATMGQPVSYNPPFINPKFIGTVKYGYLPDSSEEPSSGPSSSPTSFPSSIPSEIPSSSISPSDAPSNLPSLFPSELPSKQPSSDPSNGPSESMTPSSLPSHSPSLTSSPSSIPSESSFPSSLPSSVPSVRAFPSDTPSLSPSVSMSPSQAPTSIPSLSLFPSSMPSDEPSDQPSLNPSTSAQPSLSSQPSSTPSDIPSHSPSDSPSSFPTHYPTSSMEPSVSSKPTGVPSSRPSASPVKVQENPVTSGSFKMRVNWKLNGLLMAAGSLILFYV